MIQWAIINDADGAWLSGPLDAEPTAPAGQHVIQVRIDYPDACLWDPTKCAFVDKPGAMPAALMSVGRFWASLFTQPERLAIRSAAKQDAHVEDFVETLAGFTEGVSVSDPMMAVAIGQLQAAGLLTADRAASILAGTAP